YCRMMHTFSVYRLRRELGGWIDQDGYTHALTLNTDRELSLTRIETIFGTFCHKVDKAALGRNAQRMPADQRFRAIAFPEHLNTNAHLHVAADLSQVIAKFEGVGRPLDESLRQLWLQSTRGSGSIDV